MLSLTPKKVKAFILLLGITAGSVLFGLEAETLQKALSSPHLRVHDIKQLKFYTRSESITEISVFAPNHDTGGVRFSVCVAKASDGSVKVDFCRDRTVRESCVVVAGTLSRNVLGLMEIVVFQDEKTKELSLEIRNAAPNGGPMIYPISRLVIEKDHNKVQSIASEFEGIQDLALWDAVAMKKYIAMEDVIALSVFYDKDGRESGTVLMHGGLGAMMCYKN